MRLVRFAVIAAALFTATAASAGSQGEFPWQIGWGGIHLPPPPHG